jgi:hypothetical protein
VENIFENAKYKIIWFPEEKIVEFCMKDIEIEKQDIIEMHEQTLKMTGGLKYANIFTAQDFFSITGEARVEGSKPYYSKNLMVQALIVKNLAQRLIGNFIMKFNKPVRETKMFATREEGKVWVLSKIKEIETNKSEKELLSI